MKEIPPSANHVSQPARDPRLDEIAAAFIATGDARNARAQLLEHSRTNSSAMAALAELVNSSDPGLRLVAAHGLAAQDTSASASQLSAAIAKIESGVPKRQLCEVLGSFRNPQASEFFLGLAQSNGDPEIVAGAHRALCNMANASLVAEIVRKYRASRSFSERGNLLSALRHMQNEECIPALIAVLDDQKVISKTDPLGVAAAETLGVIGAEAAVSNLLTRLAFDGEGSGSPLYRAVAQAGNPGSLRFLESVAAGRTPGFGHYGRLAAIEALGNHDDPGAGETLTRIAQAERNASFRAAALNSLRRVAERGNE